MRHLARLTLFLLAALLALAPAAPGRAQDASVYPLPADLYILTSENRLLRIDAETGEQTVVSPEGQPVAAFDISPDGGWYAYRTLDNQAVIVASLTSINGYVAAFDQPLPQGGGAQAIAWSPDGQRIAYTVPEGVRVTGLQTPVMAEVETALIEGAWTGVYWADDNTIIATGPGGAARLFAGEETWLVEAEPSPPQPTLSADASLTPEGVQLGDGRIVPFTAGTLAFDWAPLPLPELPDGILPAPLYYLARDGSGIAQVWELTADAPAPRPVTAGSQPVVDFAVAAERVAYVTQSEVGIVALDGSAGQAFGALTTGSVRPTIALNADASQIAFSDDRGLWTVSVDGSQQPRLIVPHVLTDDPATLRVYMQPRWNTNETALLVTIGLYEGSMLGVVSLADGAVTEMPMSAAGVTRWTADGRIATGSATMMYAMPGLYLLDPAAPDAEPVTLVGPETPVLDARQTPDGSWAVIAGASGGMGPQWVRLLTGTEESGIIPAFDEAAGAFIEQPVLAPGGAIDAPTIAAGLRNLTYAEDGLWGDPVVADLSTGETFAVPAPGLVSRVMWGY